MKSSKTHRSNFAAIFSLCAVMFSAYVGPGFASGTQTVTYFNNKGWIGVFLGLAIAGLLCFIFNLLLFEINRIYKPKTYREAYNTIYRQTIAVVLWNLQRDPSHRCGADCLISPDLYHGHLTESVIWPP